MGLKKRIDLGYEPRPQQLLIHQCAARLLVLVTHRRMGKTVCMIMELLSDALRSDNNEPRYAYIAPTYSQAKRIAWDYLLGFCKNLPDWHANLKELTVTIRRGWKGDSAKIMLLGSESPDSLRGIYLDGAVLDEYGSIPSILLPEVIRPALSDRKGWLRLVGTPRGKNHFERIYRKALEESAAGNTEWAGMMYKASETGIIDESELKEIRTMLSESEYRQEFECDFDSDITGSYYGQELRRLEARGRILPIEIAKGVPCYTYWDLGMDDSTAIWTVQVVNDEIRFVDYLENSGKALSWYVEELVSKKRLYVPFGHVLPHDVRVRELGTGVSRLKTLWDMGFQARAIEKKTGFDAGIEAARRLLSGNVWIDSVRCQRGLDALRAYSKRYDSKAEIYLKGPNRDWSTHGADAFRYAAIDLRGGDKKIRMESIMDKRKRLKPKIWDELEGD